MHSVLEETRRLSIHSGPVSIDVVLSAAVPVESLIPPIIDALGFGPGQVAVRWCLRAQCGAALDTSKTLKDLGIRDGSVLNLASSSTEYVVPRCDDAAEAISASIAVVDRRWTRRAAQLVGGLVASCWSGVCATVLLRAAFDVNDAHRAACVGVAVAVGIGALLAMIIAYRVIGERGAALTLGLIATGFAALAGLIAVPGGPDASNALFAAAAAALFSVITLVIGCHAAVFVTLACLATTCVIAAVVSVLSAAPLPVTGAGLATTSLALIEASPRVSIILARLSPQLCLDAAGVDPDQLHTRLIQAHTWLTSLVTTFSVSAALGAISALFGASPVKILFAVAIGGILLLRSRAHQDIGRSVPPVVCGTVTLGAVLVAVAAAYPQHAPLIGGSSMALGFLALYLGFIGSAVVTSAAGRRSVELVEYLALAGVVPLTFWLTGLFGAARSVNLP